MEARGQVRDLLLRLRAGDLNWSAALLCSHPTPHTARRTLSSRQPVSHRGWAPQILVTASLTAPAGWESGVANAVVQRQDAKAAAALVATTEGSSPALKALADHDAEGGASIAIAWRTAIGAAFDEAGLTRTW